MISFADHKFDFRIFKPLPFMVYRIIYEPVITHSGVETLEVNLPNLSLVLLSNAPLLLPSPAASTHESAFRPSPE